MNGKSKATLSLGSARGKRMASIAFGGLLLLFILGVFLFPPEHLPPYKQRILAMVSAILAGLFGYFMTGSIGVKFGSLRTKFGDATVDATGGLALFVLVLVWWSSPIAPVTPNDNTAIVRVTVLGSDHIPIDNAQVWTSIGGEAKKVTGGWELEFPLSKLPEDRKLTIYAAQQEAHLKGLREIRVSEDVPVTTEILLTRDVSAQVKGNVYDEAGKPIPGANVTIVGSNSSITTNDQGYFSLPAQVANGEDVRLRVSKLNYEIRDQYHPAGEDPAYVELHKEKR